MELLIVLVTADIMLSIYQIITNQKKEKPEEDTPYLDGDFYTNKIIDEERGNE